MPQEIILAQMNLTPMLLQRQMTTLHTTVMEPNLLKFRSMKQNLKTIANKLGYEVSGHKAIHVPQPLTGQFKTFTLEMIIHTDDLVNEYASRGLVPADPFSILEHIKPGESLATHWKGKNGRWYYCMVRRNTTNPRVKVGRYRGNWDDLWRFAGIKLKI